jgi:hypothetical protein
MKIPFCLKPDVLHHAHGVDLHEDRFYDLIPFNCSKKLPVGIADLLFLLKDIHPDFSIRSHLSMDGTIPSVISFTHLQNAETQKKKQGKGQRK